MLSQKIKFISFGLGPVGLLILKSALDNPNFQLVGAVDVNPNLVGQNVGELVDKTNEIVIHERLQEIAAVSQADLVFHATQSYLDQAAPQFIELLSRGLNVISTCETLAYPFRRYPDLALQLDKTAKSNHCTLTGTGINPGFLLDALPIFLTSVCHKVTEIQAIRQINAAKRRGPFQQKIGLNLLPRTFEQQKKQKMLSAHVGLTESVYLIGDTLGLNLEKVTEEHIPVIADQAFYLPNVKIEAGRVQGINSCGRGLIGQKEVVRLDFNAVVNNQEYEEIKINGVPSISWRNQIGTSGDVATAAIILNLSQRVINAPPGLQTILDLPLSYCIGNKATSKTSLHRDL